MENRRKTTNYFPEPRFQFRFLRFLLLGAVVQIVATCAILYHFLRQNYELLVQYAGLPPEIIALLDRELWILVGVIGVTFFLYVLGVILLGVLFSHQVAGVIYALKRTILELNEGKDAKLHTREGDEFKDLVDDFNELISNLRSGNLKGSSQKKRVSA